MAGNSYKTEKEKASTAHVQSHTFIKIQKKIILGNMDGYN